MHSISPYNRHVTLLKNFLKTTKEILSDVSLIEGLENTKAAALEIQTKVGEAKDKEIAIRTRS